MMAYAVAVSDDPNIIKNSEGIILIQLLRAILCKYGASYIGTISRSDSDFDETC